jgi:excisionase family DNA binding protein
MIASPTFFNCEQAAQYLNISQSWLYKLTSARQIPHYKPSPRVLYFTKEDLDGWVLSSRVKSASEIATEASQLGRKIFGNRKSRKASFA